MLQLLNQFFILHGELGCRHNIREVVVVFGLALMLMIRVSVADVVLESA